MTVGVSNLPEFDAKVKAWFAAVRKGTEQAAKGLAQQAFDRVLRTSPQYSGTFVANWRMNVGTPDTSWDEDPLGTKGDRPAPYKLGDRRAIDYAKSHEVGKLSGFSLGQTIHISNSTMGEYEIMMGQTGEFPLAIAIEEGEIKLRPENAGAEKVVRRARDVLANRYRSIGKDKLSALLRIGV